VLVAAWESLLPKRTVVLAEMVRSRPPNGELHGVNSKRLSGSRYKVPGIYGIVGEDRGRAIEGVRCFFARGEGSARGGGGGGGAWRVCCSLMD
jgi:hypothetical protein